MNHISTFKNQGQISIGSKVRVEANGWTQANALLVPPMQSVNVLSSCRLEKNVKNFGNKVNKDEEKKRDTCIMHSKSFLP